MIKKSKISVALSALAIVGVGVTAFLAHKRSYILDEKTEDKIAEKWNAMTDEEFEEHAEMDGSELLTVKDKAVIFVKAEWPTLIAGAATCGCVIAAQSLNLTEIVALTGALAGIKMKYRDAMGYLERNYPDQYKVVKKFVDEEAALRACEEDKPKKHKEETYDGKQRFYLPWSDQIVYLDVEDMSSIQHFIDATIGTEMKVCVNDVIGYMKYNLGYSELEFAEPEENTVFEFGPDEDICPDSFPLLEWDWDDIYDDGDNVVCRVLTISKNDNQTITASEARRFAKNAM